MEKRDFKATWLWAQCECSFFVKRRTQKEWEKADNYILKTKVSRPLKLISIEPRLKADRWEVGSRKMVEARVFCRKQLRYSFSFYLEDGEFSQMKQPPDLTLRWSGLRRRVLLVKHRGDIYRIVPRHSWFPKQTKTVWIDLERNAQIVGFKGEAGLKQWGLKSDRTMLLRKGTLLRPGYYLEIPDAAVVKVKLDTGEIKTFPERTIALFRKRPLLVGVEEKAHLRHARTSKGPIGIHRAGKHLQVPPGKEVLLHVGDMVQTAVEGRAEILFSSGQQVRVQPFCTVLVEGMIKCMILARLMEGKVGVIYEGTKGLGKRGHPLEGSCQ